METLLRAGLSNAVAAALMAVLVLLLSRPMARRPAILHGLWLLVLIKLVTPPFYELAFPWPLASPASAEAPLEVSIVGVDPLEESAPDEAAGPRGANPGHADEGAGDVLGEPCQIPLAIAARAMPSGFDRALRWIGLTWLAGSSVVLLVSSIRIRRFQRLLKAARRGTWQEQDWIDEWAGRLGVRRAPDLWWIPGPISPMIWFVGLRPRLILPHDLWKRLDGRQRSTLIVHELAHIRRGDHRVRLLEMLVTALYWWHPLVWWMRGPLREAEEQCCDAWVVWALPDAVRAYAETVLDTLEFLQPSRRPAPGLAIGLGRVPHLKRRLTMIMSGTSRRLPGLPGRLGLFATAAVLLPIGASWAQKADEKPGEKTVAVSPDKLDVSDEVELQGKLNPPAAGAEAKETPVVVRFTVNRGEGVELSGSLDEVIGKLEVLIAKLKQEAASKPAAKVQVGALTKALEAIKSAKSIPVSVAVLSDRNAAERQKFHALLAKKDVEQKPGASSPEKAEQIAKTRQEVARLRKVLDGTLVQLKKAQARLHELGEDPGDMPLFDRQRSKPAPGVVLEKKLTVVRPKADPRDVRRIIVRPLKPGTAGSDQERLESLEKRFKDLQQEFERLKKDSESGGEKK